MQTFVVVGMFGFVLQLAVLYWLATVVRLPYGLATLLAVEAAIVHNFFWHERITWADRRREAGSSAQRLLRFHLGTGLTSLLGNLAVTTFAVEALHLPALLANAMAVGTTSLANFLVADRYVFSSTSATVIVAAIFLGSASSLA
jgi:putative flippase GtrA